MPNSLIRNFTGGILFIFSAALVQAQVPADIFLNLSDMQTRQLNRGGKLFEEAEYLFKEAKTLYENTYTDSGRKDPLYAENMKRAIRLIIQSSDSYKYSTELIYQVYKDKADAFWTQMRKEGHYAVGLEKARYLEREARGFFSNANLMRVRIDNAAEFMEAFNLHNESRQMERDAIRFLSRACQIYQDYPIEYDYGWVDDINIDEILALKNLTYVDPPAPVVETIVEEPVKNERDTCRITYRIQIAAHTVSIREIYLRSLYKGEQKIIEVREGKWYKYQYGNYDSYAKAEQELNDVRIDRAFVIAYCNNSYRFSIQKARAMAP